METLRVVHGITISIAFIFFIPKLPLSACIIVTIFVCLMLSHKSKSDKECQVKIQAVTKEASTEPDDPPRPCLMHSISSQDSPGDFQKTDFFKEQIAELMLSIKIHPCYICEETNGNGKRKKTCINVLLQLENQIDLPKHCIGKHFARGNLNRQNSLSETEAKRISETRRGSDVNTVFAWPERGFSLFLTNLGLRYVLINFFILFELKLEKKSLVAKKVVSCRIVSNDKVKSFCCFKVNDEWEPQVQTKRGYALFHPNGHLDVTEHLNVQQWHFTRKVLPTLN